MDVIEEFVVHHSGGPRSQSVAAIKRFHTAPKPEGRGYSDIAYHAIIDGSAKLHIGRPIPTTGAHAPPNSKRIGICVVGNNTKPSQSWTSAQKKALLRYWQAVQIIWPNIKLGGHCDYMPGHTVCPGVDVRGLLLEE